MDYSVAIAFVALVIAIYGVFERRYATYSALRVRLTELLADIEQLNIEELKYGDVPDGVGSTGEDSGDPSPSFRQAGAGYASRRALLTYQALALLHRLRRSLFSKRDAVSAAEYSSLATSLRWCGDLTEACEQWRRAVSTQGFVPSVVLAASYRGLADALMELGEYEDGRDNYRKAAATESGCSASQRWSAFSTYLEWLGHEQMLKDGVPEVPVRGAYEIASDYTTWGPTLLDELRLRARTTIQVNGHYRNVGVEELLDHSMADLLTGSAE